VATTGSRLRRWVSMGLVFVFAIATSGCSLENFKTEAAQVPELVTSVLSGPATFNYALSQESPNVFTYTYEGLVTSNPNTGEVEPALAESWEISADKLKITFLLRPNLKWSDGQPLTTDDIVFTYNDIYLNEDVPTDVRDALRIGESGAFPKIRKIDDRRVEFTVPEPFAPFLEATGTPIMPAHILRETIEKKGSDGKPIFNSTWSVETAPEKIIVNGPYKLVNYAVDQRIIYRRNPYYWRYQVPDASNGNIERIVWQIVESADASLLQFRSGGLDSVAVTPEQFSLLKREEKAGNFEILEGGPAPGTNFVFFNLNTGKRKGRPLVDPVKSKWFNNVAFRQATAYAINRPKMLTNTFLGLGKPQDSPVSVQSPFYLSPEEGLKTYDYNPKKAKQLLTAAGFQYKGQELYDQDGNRVQFVLKTNAGNATREALGAQIKQDLAGIGMQVDFAPLAFGTLVDQLSSSLEWECVLLGLTGGTEPHFGKNVWDPNGGLHMFNQAAAGVEGRVINDWEQEIGQLYTQGARELDEAKRKAIYGKTQQISQEQLPLIYLINPLSLTAIRNKFTGIEYSALGGAFWNIHDISAEAPEKSELTE
jgi:peptide/nickel transport system substrate-binding protein